MAPEQRDAVLNAASREPMTVAVSALTGEGVEELLKLIDSNVADRGLPISVTLDAEDGEALAWFYDHGQVRHRETGDDGVTRLELILPEADLGRLEKKFPHLFARIVLPVRAAD